MTGKRIIGVAAGLALLAAMTWSTAGCSSGSTTTPPPTTSKTFASTIVNYHQHTVTVNKSDVQTPPAAGLSLTTSTASGHSHTVNITQAELQSVNAGTAESVNTNPSDTTGTHFHEFTISKWF